MAATNNLLAHSRRWWWKDGLRALAGCLCHKPGEFMRFWDFDFPYKEFTATGPLRNMVVRVVWMSRGDLFDL